MKPFVIGVAALCLVSGCSQVSALAPVGGDRVTGVRYAANDLLVGAGIEVLTAPVCVQASDKGVTCEGTTRDAQPIRVVSRADDQARMTLTVGDRTLYDGDIQTVLEEAMQR